MRLDNETLMKQMSRHNPLIAPEVGKSAVPAVQVHSPAAQHQRHFPSSRMLRAQNVADKLNDNVDGCELASALPEGALYIFRLAGQLTQLPPPLSLFIAALHPPFLARTLALSYPLFLYFSRHASYANTLLLLLCPSLVN